MPGTVVTFYSYKGGVGRSFSLANIAILLARWGYRVLAIDWDLEAPGLHQYFASLMVDPPGTGLVDLVDDFRAGVASPAAHLTRLDLEGPGIVDLLPAGRQDRTTSAGYRGSTGPNCTSVGSRTSSSGAGRSGRRTTTSS